MSAQSAHYACVIFQGWLYLCELSHRYGERLIFYSAPNGASLGGAIDWLSCHLGFSWPYAQEDEAFDADRFVPIVYSARRLGVQVDVSSKYEMTIEAVAQDKPIFEPCDGVRPFWSI